MLHGLPTCDALEIVKINTEAPCLELINVTAMKDKSNVSDSVQIERSKQYIAPNVPIEEKTRSKAKRNRAKGSYYKGVSANSLGELYGKKERNILTHN